MILYGLSMVVRASIMKLNGCMQLIDTAYRT